MFGCVLIIVEYMHVLVFVCSWGCGHPLAPRWFFLFGADGETGRHQRSCQVLYRVTGFGTNSLYIEVIVHTIVRTKVAYTIIVIDRDIWTLKVYIDEALRLQLNISLCINDVYSPNPVPLIQQSWAPNTSGVRHLQCGSGHVGSYGVWGFMGDWRSRHG